jgi:hypothetical protein
VKDLQDTLHRESNSEVAGARDHLGKGLELILQPIHEIGNINVIRERGWTNTVLVQGLLVLCIEQFQLRQSFRSARVSLRFTVVLERVENSYSC